MPSQRRIKELFTYDDKGHLRAKITSSHHRKAGDIVGCLKTNGYKMAMVDRVNYYIHRLVWVYHNGPIPDGMVVDHINMERKDNRVENLRLVTRTENNKKLSLRSDNKTGVIGVSWCRRWKKYHARVKISGKEVFARYFHNLEEAAKAVEQARQSFGFDELHGSTASSRKAS
jgi:hypothetical protein